MLHHFPKEYTSSFAISPSERNKTQLSPLECKICLSVALDIWIASLFGNVIVHASYIYITCVSLEVGLSYCHNFQNGNIKWQFASLKRVCEILFHIYSSRTSLMHKIKRNAGLSAFLPNVVKRDTDCLRDEYVAEICGCFRCDILGEKYTRHGLVMENVITSRALSAKCNMWIWKWLKH